MPPRVIKGSPVILDLSEAGGGQLLVGNNQNDNKVFLQGLSTNGQANASELLVTGRSITSLPLVSVLADITRILGHLQIGEGFNAAFTVSPSDASPNAGFIRFGDSTGWRLHIGRARERGAGVLNAGTDGVLMTIQDNGNIGIATTQPQERLDIVGNMAVSGDVRLTGADCAEDFDVRDAEALEPGTVMIIGADSTLCASTEAYDTRVAGVLSGAGDCRPGIILGREPLRPSRLPLALSGKAFCQVDAQHGSIGLGDLLTTSPRRGHAMKASDSAKAYGAVIGKALHPLTEGQGLIPILIALH
jgi:hypothetical protein